MTTIDISFDDLMITELRQMAGKRLESFKCSPFFSMRSSTGSVAIRLGDGSSYACTNRFGDLEYLGEPEDVAVFRLESCDWNNIWTPLKDKTMVVTQIGGRIKKIVMINETQKIFVDGFLKYVYLLTRGIVFYMDDGLELAFEKNVWFSDQISIWKGYDVLKNFIPTSEFEERFSGGARGICVRDLIEFLSS